MKKILDKVTWLIEKILISNMTLIIIVLLFWIILFSIFCIISIEYTFTAIWAILAFWYWYKKYERDKEIELVYRYTWKYNLLMNKLSGCETTKEKIKSYWDLLNLFYEEYYLYCKNYISTKLWKEWKEWIYLDIFEILNHDSENNDDKMYWRITNKFFGYNSENNILNDEWNNFILFMKDILLDYKINTLIWLETDAENEIFDYLSKSDKYTGIEIDINWKEISQKIHKERLETVEPYIELTDIYYRTTLKSESYKKQVK